jgi:hypothetical protein
MHKIGLFVVVASVAACSEAYAPATTSAQESFADEQRTWLEAHGFPTMKRAINGSFEIDVPADRVDAAIASFVVDERGTRPLKPAHERPLLAPTPEQRALAEKIEARLLAVPGYTSAHVIVSTPAPIAPRPDDHTQWLHLREPTAVAHVAIAYVPADERGTAPSVDGKLAGPDYVMRTVAEAVGIDPRDVSVRMLKVMPPRTE